MIRPAILIALGGVVIALAIALNFFISDDASLVDDRTSQQTQSSKSASEKTETKAPPPNSVSAAAQTAPTFDVVRLNPTGDAVMAGGAEPSSVVEIYDQRNKLGEVQADGRGEWVFVPTKPLPPGSRELSLRATGKGGIATPSKPEENIILVVPEKGKDIAGRPSEEPSSPLAFKVPRQGRGTLEVLQKPAPGPAESELLSALAGDAATGPAVATATARKANTVARPTSPSQPLTVDAIDYDDSGVLYITGHAPQGALVHLYLNNKFLGRVVAGARNIWRTTPKYPAPAGVHKLRADLVNKSGKVLSRIEVIFARSVPLKDVPPGTLVVVEPGNSLWRIARRAYGSGFRYTVIYEANKRQIQNVNLIFPGQVFSLPSIN